MSKYNYLTEENLLQQFKDAKRFMEPLFQPLDEFERIARNKPHPSIPKNLPKVTDGTLSSIIQETPKRIIQQIPTGRVESDDEWLDIVAGFIFEHEILPNSNTTAALIQKCWAMTSKSLTYGAQPVFVQFVNRGEYFGTDFTLPYIKDVFLEPGKLSDRDCNVMFMRSWYQPSDIDQIIYKEEYLGQQAKKRKDKYVSGWDLERLKQAKEEKKQKDVQAQSPNERTREGTNTAIEIIHAFQKGIGATFYSFCPDLPEGEQIVRKRESKDPRGAIPIHYMYANLDLSNPLGRGSVELSGGMQNLLDSEVQSYQYMRALLQNPPLEIRGNIPSSTLKYAPKALWKLGTDPNNSVRPVDLSTKSLEQFPANYGLMKSQILQLNSGGGDTTTSADTGNQSSKTPQGVKLTEQKLGVSDNYVRKQFEDLFQEVAETEINLYFAERSGTQELQLDDDTAAKLRKINPGAVSKDNKIRINYDSETPKMKFTVDASTSSVKDDADERDRLVELMDMAQKYPALGQIVDTQELANRIVVKTGVEDPEKIVPKAQDNTGATPQIDPKTGQPIPQAPGQGQPQIDPATGQPIPPQGAAPSLQPQDVQQMIDEALKANQKNDLNQHPLIRVMESLSIKFAELPEDSKQELLKLIGIPSNQLSPVQQKLNQGAVSTAAQVHSTVNQIDPNQPVQDPNAVNPNSPQDPNAQPASPDASNNLPEPANQETPQEDTTEPVEENTTQHDMMLVAELRKRGYNDTQIQDILTQVQSGTPNENILQGLGAQNGQ